MKRCTHCGQTLPSVTLTLDGRQEVLPLADTRWEKDYNEGYESGLTWDANWIPGGPHEFPGQKGRNDAYLSGWRNGLNERLRINKRFACWWSVWRGVHSHERYTETK